MQKVELSAEWEESTELEGLKDFMAVSIREVEAIGGSEGVQGFN